MNDHITPQALAGVWSATPTPFTDRMDIDRGSVRRMIEHHLRLGVTGLFLAGTCGEGPWMPDALRWKLVETAAEFSDGRLLLAVQVTDNSSARILDNMHRARKAGGDIAVIAPPYFVVNRSPRALFDLYAQAIRHSPMPVGIYDRGAFSPVQIPTRVLRDLYRQRNVILIKDSSADLSRIKLAMSARKERPRLRLFTGWEFNTAPYLRAGYDGVLVGGGIFNGFLAGQIIDAVRANEFDRADRLQKRMNRLMWSVYGGRKIKCWLSGLKKLLVEMGIFRTWKNFPDYPLTDSCVQAIRRVLKKDADILMPWKK